MHLSDAFDQGYQHISGAPRDGTTVELLNYAYGEGPRRMRWSADTPNRITGEAGTWESEDGAFVWNEGLKDSPTMWRRAASHQLPKQA